ncbi:hypothetical protein FGB62_9g47 [Gracilaria domingensis]|nr:hypothetical protein FGB62_9g47 [Gracilaria domingensis]
MSALRTTSVVVVEGVPHDVVTAMPIDVMNGTLMTLLIDGMAMKTLRVLRLSAMGRSYLQLGLKLLLACSSLTELWFVDVPGGVTVPAEVARRVQVLSIVRLHKLTLKSLYEAKCAPKRLRLSCVGRQTEIELYDGWRGLTRESTRVDVTWTFDWTEPVNEVSPLAYLALSFEQLSLMRVRTWRCSAPLGPPYASSMRAIEEDASGWKTVRISKWLQEAVSRAPRREAELFGEEGLLTVVVDGPHEAYMLQRDEGALLKRFVREIVSCGSSDGRVDKLQVLVANLYGEEGQTTANVAARLAAEAAAAGGIRELTRAAGDVDGAGETGGGVADAVVRLAAGDATGRQCGRVAEEDAAAGRAGGLSSCGARRAVRDGGARYARAMGAGDVRAPH